MLDFTDYNFDNLLNAIPGLAVVDFWSTWCRPCNMLTPVIDSLSQNNTDVAIGKVNTVENPAITARFGVRVVPTIIFFKNGQVVKKIVGYHSEAQLQKYVNELK